MGRSLGPFIVVAGIAIAVIGVLVAVGVMHPLEADLDDDTLRAQLLRITCRFLAASDAGRDPDAATTRM
jgi:hypothetical protein